MKIKRKKMKFFALQLSLILVLSAMSYAIPVNAASLAEESESLTPEGADQTSESSQAEEKSGAEEEQTNKETETETETGTETETETETGTETETKETEIETEKTESEEIGIKTFAVRRMVSLAAEDKNTSLELQKSVGGKDIVENELYEFEITITNLPDVLTAGSKYPITFTGSTQSDRIGTLSDNSAYIVFDGKGKTSVFMKADDTLTISGLPAGAEFVIKETDAKSSTYMNVAGENCQNLKLNGSTRQITGKTAEKWSDSTGYSLSKVKMTNLFGKVPVNTDGNNGGSSSENEQESNSVTVKESGKTEPSDVKKVPVNATSPKTGETNHVLGWLSGMFKAAGF